MGGGHGQIKMHTLLVKYTHNPIFWTPHPNMHAPFVKFYTLPLWNEECCLQSWINMIFFITFFMFVSFQKISKYKYNMHTLNIYIYIFNIIKMNRIKYKLAYLWDEFGVENHQPTFKREINICNLKLILTIRVFQSWKYRINIESLYIKVDEKLWQNELMHVGLKRRMIDEHGKVRIVTWKRWRH